MIKLPSLLLAIFVMGFAALPAEPTAATPTQLEMAFDTIEFN